MFSLTALGLLFLVVVSPLRLRLLENLFGGLPSLYRWHHRMTWALLLIIGFHAFVTLSPFLKLASTWKERINLFFNPQDGVTFSGTTALILLTLVQGFSYATFLQRSMWLRLHRIGIFGLGAVVVHVSLAAPLPWAESSSWDFTHLAPHALLAIAVILLLIHWIAPEKLSRHSKFCVSDVRHLRPDVVELNLSLTPQPHYWQPGTFGFFRFDCHGPCRVSRERHPFTVLNRDDQHLKILVKAAGDDTGHLQHIIKGTCGEVTGPHGSFIKLTSQETPQLWLAGGLGVAPFWGLLQNQEWEYRSVKNVILIAQNRKNSNPLFRHEMQQFAKNHPWFHFIPIDDEPGSELNWERLIQMVPDWQTRIVALAGPQPMIKLWRYRFREKKLKMASIFTEEFIQS